MRARAREALVDVIGNNHTILLWRDWRIRLQDVLGLVGAEEVLMVVFIRLISPNAVRPSSLQKLTVDCASEYHRKFHEKEIKDVLRFCPNGCLSSGFLTLLKNIFLSVTYEENGDFC